MLKKITRWVLTRNKLEKHDVLWLKGFNMDVSCTRREIPYAMGNRMYQAAGPIEVVITTVNQKQEDMLQLKYGNEVLRATVFMINPGEQIQDNWGTVTLCDDGTILSTTTSIS